jgi:enamine deaminase RidA (YjgF/YER057c/UK114 family)
MPRQNIQPEALSKRVVQGQVLYSHVVVVEGRRTIFIAGQLARDRQGNVVGKGDMRAQIRQVGENLKAALAAAGALWTIW